MYYKYKIFGGKKKMQKSSWMRAWKCECAKKLCVYRARGPRLCSTQYVLFFLCPCFDLFCCCCCCSSQKLFRKKYYYLLTLHWVSSSPHSANRRWTSLSTEGRWWQFTCTCLLKDLMDFVCLFVCLCFHFICKKFIYLIVAFIVE